MHGVAVRYLHEYLIAQNMGPKNFPIMCAFVREIQGAPRRATVPIGALSVYVALLWSAEYPTNEHPISIAAAATATAASVNWLGLFCSLILERSERY